MSSVLGSMANHRSRGSFKKTTPRCLPSHSPNIVVPLRPHPTRNTGGFALAWEGKHFSNSHFMRFVSQRTLLRIDRTFVLISFTILTALGAIFVGLLSRVQRSASSWRSLGEVCPSDRLRDEPAERRHAATTSPKPTRGDIVECTQGTGASGL